MPARDFLSTAAKAGTSVQYMRAVASGGELTTTPVRSPAWACT
jgi:hypothetical protein